MHWKKEGESIFAAYGENAIHDKVPAIIIDALGMYKLCDLRESVKLRKHTLYSTDKMACSHNLQTIIFVSRCVS